MGNVTVRGREGDEHCQIAIVATVKTVPGKRDEYLKHGVLPYAVTGKAVLTARALV